MIRASRARATNRRRKRILRLQKSYPSFGASVKISVSKKEPQRCFVEVLDESASPLTTGVLRDGPLRRCRFIEDLHKTSLRLLLGDGDFNRRTERWVRFLKPQYSFAPAVCRSCAAGSNHS